MAGTEASRTAVLVCQGRAVAHDRLAPGRFDDPTALALLREDERRPVERARSDGPPKGLTARLDVELLGRQAEAMALRTVAVDDAVRSATNPQLVIVGAGLDGRAWRMPELAQVVTFEVDHPASQDDKRARAAALGPTVGPRHDVAVDLTSDDLGTALDAAGHDVRRPTTWVLEGVLPYLTSDVAASTIDAIASRSTRGSVVIITYQTASRSAGVSRVLARAALMLMRRGDPMASEARRSAWSQESVEALLARAGLRIVEDVGLSSLAGPLGVPTRHTGTSRVTIAAVPPAGDAPIGFRSGHG